MRKRPPSYKNCSFIYTDPCAKLCKCPQNLMQMLVFKKKNLPENNKTLYSAIYSDFFFFGRIVGCNTPESKMLKIKFIIFNKNMNQTRNEKMLTGQRFGENQNPECAALVNCPTPPHTPPLHPHRPISSWVGSRNSATLIRNKLKMNGCLSVRKQQWITTRCHSRN